MAEDVAVLLCQEHSALFFIRGNDLSSIVEGKVALERRWLPVAAHVGFADFQTRERGDRLLPESQILGKIKLWQPGHQEQLLD